MTKKFQPPTAESTGRPCGHCTRMNKPCRYHGGQGNAGPKPKLTPDLIQKAEQLLTRGNYQETVAHALSIHPATWHRWIAQGQHQTEQDKTGPERDLYEAATRARATAETEAVKLLQDAAKPHTREVLTKSGDVVQLEEPGDWRATAHFLERAFPDRWGKREKFEHDGELRIRVNPDLIPEKAKDES